MLVMRRRVLPASTRCVGRQFESKRQTPTPRWHTARPSSSSASMPSGPAWPPESWIATPVLESVPPAMSGNRQICCERVIATYTCVLDLLSVMPLGEGALSTRRCSSPFARRRYTRPLGSAIPVCPWSVKYRSPLSAKFRPFGQPSYWTTSSHSPFGSMRNMRPKGMSTHHRFPSRSKDGPSRKLSTCAPPRLGSDQGVRRFLRNFAGSEVKGRAWMRLIFWNGLCIAWTALLLHPLLDRVLDVLDLVDLDVDEAPADFLDAADINGL